MSRNVVLLCCLLSLPPHVQSFRRPEVPSSLPPPQDLCHECFMLGHLPDLQELQPIFTECSTPGTCGCPAHSLWWSIPANPLTSLGPKSHSKQATTSLTTPKQAPPPWSPPPTRFGSHTSLTWEIGVLPHAEGLSPALHLPSASAVSSPGFLSAYTSY